MSDSVKTRTSAKGTCSSNPKTSCRVNLARLDAGLRWAATKIGIKKKVEIEVVSKAVDGDFNTLLELGFRTSIRKEWEWRVSRGESLKNLRAFEHLIDDQDDD